MKKEIRLTQKSFITLAGLESKPRRKHIDMGLLKKLFSLFSSGDKKPEKKVQAEPNIGVVRNFNHSRGFGFIHSKSFDRKIFLHISDMEHRVRVGQKVKFEVETTEKGLRAKNVEPLTNNG